MGGWGDLMRRIQDGQGDKNGMNKGSHPANKQNGVMTVKGRPFGDISGYKRRSDDVHGLSSSTEAEICNRSIGTEMPGCKPALERAGFDAAYCISGEALEIPSAHIKAVHASLLPAAQRDIHKARNAII